MHCITSAYWCNDQKPAWSARPKAACSSIESTRVRYASSIAQRGWDSNGCKSHLTLSISHRQSHWNPKWDAEKIEEPKRKRSRTCLSNVVLVLPAPPLIVRQLSIGIVKVRTRLSKSQNAKSKTKKKKRYIMRDRDLDVKMLLFVWAKGEGKERKENDNDWILNPRNFKIRETKIYKRREVKVKREGKGLEGFLLLIHSVETYTPPRSIIWMCMVSPFLQLIKMDIVARSGKFPYHHYLLCFRLSLCLVMFCLVSRLYKPRDPCPQANRSYGAVVDVWWLVYPVMFSM